MSNTLVACPCCRSRVDHRRMRQTFALFPFDGMMMTASMDAPETFIEILRRYPQMYQWACDDCLNGRLAIRADPSKQFYTFRYPWDTAQPYFAYFDKQRTCSECRVKFTFSKEEQQYWYEQLRFVVYSVPTTCKTCGRARKLNKELSNLLREGTPDDLADLERIAAIYTEMGKVEKSKAYRAEIRKRKAQ